MNETITVLIGTLSGFIIAFFAEPVKNYFQNKSKLHNLRVALYKELVHNYIALDHYTVKEDAKYESVSQFLETEQMVQFALRTECYKHAIQNEISLFYQLSEANTINALQGTFISRLTGFSTDPQSWFGEGDTWPAAVDAVRTTSVTFREMFAVAAYQGWLAKKILEKLMKQGYLELLERGKKVVEKDPDLLLGSDPIA